MTQTRQQLGKARRWIIKIGSALLTNEGRGLDHEALAGWAEQIARLRASGREVVLVSSGAVAEGMSRLGWTTRPHALHELQAAAAVGQMGLVQAYESIFQRHGLRAAQVLLTHDDLSNRRRYLNARSTLRTLLALGVIPVVNENDTVATDEIRFGDNDTLAALVGNLTEAQVLVILTDQKGLFDRDPRAHADAQLVSEGLAMDPELLKLAAPTFGQLGRGGMATKLHAAARAARSGAYTLIASGREPRVLERIAEGEQIGTLLCPDKEPLAARKQWIAGQLIAKGELILDTGATKVLREAGRSLLPVGVTHVKGEFSRGDVVTCVDPDGRPVARGLVNYSADEARRIMKHRADEIEGILGYVDEPELIHRDNLVLL
ncbi:glutamate 5-kinase [Thioalkalivibrio sulfidiphilus HL-EbGr7]|uniref:Glutamate 5-kinase n=1 Tax=Thioalkalivibrio sulfidiphilus (strain HL-EbGR7) TaxID=396588 RepID=PROB_THISH|nr:glutamate 5-kinase [Thioalkalivibrio sulfidiphilus]B8GQQ4.1 RecName: Full=Glutamate 5-kinase; AltName: Full=Gamma-glutamyl kinase; Short=GK [Thioalkalivibrio sulfidiphilus HL-EbGr7]ACL74278.1 glutamate 5-kinase [Thioalkalivibrio sulfidiphilus HL-EbGr7]